MAPVIAFRLVLGKRDESDVEAGNSGTRGEPRSMRRKLRGAALVAGLLLSGSAAGHAAIDLRCSNTTFTSAVNGVVENATGTRIPGLTVELHQTNRQLPFDDPSTTNGNGEYLICVGDDMGPRHGTYDVHVRDLRSFPLYAGASQPYSTYMDPMTGADFTKSNGRAVRYMLSLEIIRDAVNPSTSPLVTWRIKSKAPSTTVMTLDRSHLGTSVTAPFVGVVAGGPSAGGWNLWEVSATISPGTKDGLHTASARGFEGLTLVTEEDTEFYVFDSVPPLLGSALPQTSQCGASVVADPMSPLTPPGTTNQRPIVSIGACDLWNDGARSGLDPFSLSGKVCQNPDLTVGCFPIKPILSTRTLIWFPDNPLPHGTYWIQWIIKDNAGNQSLNQTGYPLSIVESGGQTPVITAPFPGDLGSGNAQGVIIGSSITSPNSYPYVGFRVLDADGQQDLLPGTLKVRVYYMDDEQLVYSYDPTKPPDVYDPVTKKGGASWDLSTGLFRASGFPLQGKPPGRYSATASVMDRGGNFSTLTWNWLLAAAV